MTKSDLIWVLIRAAGVVLIVRAALVIPDFFGALTWGYYFGDADSTTTETGRMAMASWRTQLFTSSVYSVFYVALGIYLLRGGAWLHRLLSHVTPERSNTTPHADARDVPASAEAPGARAGGRER
ncbi:MAG: hypothetical protein AB7Q01_16975 [Gammaproteobacteria bacterium]